MSIAKPTWDPTGSASSPCSRTSQALGRRHAPAGGNSVRPTASITMAMADNVLLAGETSLVTITFSEAVTGFDYFDLDVPNGSLATVTSSGGGVTWTALFTPAAQVPGLTNAIALADVMDTAGNAGTGTRISPNYTINTVRPTATIVVADNALAIGETSPVTITFTEAVTGFRIADRGGRVVRDE